MRSLGLLVLAGALVCGSAFGGTVCTPGAGIFNEGDDGQGDAGGQPGTANITFGTNPLTNICGNLSDAINGADMYEIVISGTTFTATTLSINGEIADPALYLFDSSGKGLDAANNGTNPTVQAMLSVSGLTPGLYFLLIVPDGQEPEHGGNPIFGTSSTPIITTTKIDGYSGTDTGGTGKYDIQLTDAGFANVPEPATLGMIACGLGLIGLARRRRH